MACSPLSDTGRPLARHLPTYAILPVWVAGAGEPSARGGDIATQDAGEIDARVIAVLSNALFKVELGDGSLAVAHVSSSLRLGTERLLPGDRVRVALSPFDRTRGRIVYRSR
jgi:translation initiation factor IF-1